MPLMKWPTILVRLVSVILGTVLLVSAGFHLNNLIAFYETILNYRLLDPRLAALVAGILPIMQFLLGTWLVLGLHLRFASGISAGLFVIFALAQLSAYVRGLEIGCGCFGPASGVVSVGSITLVTLLAFLAMLVFHALRDADSRHES